VVNCLYGLEEELVAEVAERLDARATHGWCEVVFETSAPVARLRELRLARNLFIQFDSFVLGATAPALEKLADRLRALPVGRWQERWEQFNGEPPESENVSVSVKRTGEHNYTYKDVEELGCRVLSDALGRKVGLDARPLELRIRINQERCTLRGRLCPRPLSRRPYKVRHARCATDPTLAAAMVRVAEPTREGRFLDPFCGVGTIAIERALLGPARAVVAGDVNPRRLGWARANVEAAQVPVHLARWDARALPFESRAFSRIATSPPQGNPADGRRWELEDFAELMAECLRVLEYGGISVWLVQDGDLLESAAGLVGLSRLLETMPCQWKGTRWTIYALEKLP
jgi:23S rRNA G2445 N2-methylase RlmL